MIDLGKKMEKPCCPTPAESSSEGDTEVSYPGVWLTFEGSDPEIPESGTISFTFRRSGKTVRTKDPKRPGCIEYDLELRAISSVEKGGSPRTPTAEEALDKMVKDVEGKEDDD